MWKIQVNGKQKILISSSMKLRRKKMIDKAKQHGNKLVDEVKSLWSYHIFKIGIVLVIILLFVLGI